MHLVSEDLHVEIAFFRQCFVSIRFSEPLCCSKSLERKVVKEACALVNPLFFYKKKKKLRHGFLEWLDCGLPPPCRTDSTSASCVPAAAPAVPVTGGMGTSTWVLRY